jgi:outer membrane biosynthesis protein TonB
MKEKLSIPKSIFILVIGLHALLCCYLFLKTPSLKTLPPKLTPIQTRLVMIETPKVNPKKTDGANTLVKKESQLSSLPKKEPPKSKVPQKETPKSKPPQKEEIAKKREQLQIVLPKKEEVAKEIKTQNEIILPKAVGTLAIESTEKTTNPATPSSLTGAFAQKEYQNELTRFVRAHVKMPREGKVLLEVTISREGKILDIKVKDSTDAGILHTIKEKVAKLNLPPFSHELLGQKEQTYLLELY